jgi:pimeloyl-ACP methyl ester carboxylesterase
LNKPDDNPGWASYFLSQGYVVYILDQTSRGRSPWLPSPINNSTTLGTVSAEVIEQRFTAPELHNTYPHAGLHTQWPGGPGKGVIGQPVFDAYYASIAPSVFATVPQQTAMQVAGAALLDKIGKPAIIFGHSEGGALPWVIADVRPKLVHSIIALEPAGPPFIQPQLNGLTPARMWGLTDIPLQYDPPVSNPAADLHKRIILANSSLVENCTLQADSPQPKRLVNFQEIPVLVVTGEASWHTMYDWCTVAYLNQAGVKATHLALGDIGIHGNGHMFFLESNSDDIAAAVLKWIQKL